MDVVPAHPTPTTSGENTRGAMGPPWVSSGIYWAWEGITQATGRGAAPSLRHDKALLLPSLDSSVPGGGFEARPV